MGWQKVEQAGVALHGGSFYPDSPVAAFGAIDGSVRVFEVNEESHDDSQLSRLSFACTATVQAHGKSVRDVTPNSDGSWLITGSADTSLIVLDSQSLEGVLRIASAHGAPINCLHSFDRLHASGDDRGRLKASRQ